MSVWSIDPGTMFFRRNDIIVQESIVKEIEKINEKKGTGWTVEDFLNKKKEEKDWFYICTYPLSEEFIEFFKDEVDWIGVSRHSHLSENFIDKYSGRVSWPFIITNQDLSENFIQNHKDKFDC